MWMKVFKAIVQIAAISAAALAAEENGFCEKDSGCDKVPSVDPRLTYEVKLDDFLEPEGLNVSKVIKEITEGQGYFTLPQLFSKEDIEHAKKIVHYLIKNEGQKATHFQGYEGSKPELQARVWNLMNKGQIFEKMVQHPTVLAVLRPILGDDAQLGSIASNTIFPGGSGQEPHIDYPYWDYYNRDHWPVSPKHKDIPFFMNFQATILLDDFTEANGATAAVPGSQVTAEYPSDAEEFYRKSIRTTGKAGDVIVFVGLLQHCAMPNNADESRTGLILQYLPKFIRPMEDQKASLTSSVRDRASADLRKLLLLDYPYPAVLDAAEAGNSEGEKSDFKWKE